MGKSTRQPTGHIVNTTKIDSLAELLLMAKRTGSNYQLDLSQPSTPFIVFDDKFPIKFIDITPTEYAVFLLRWEDFFAPSKQP